MDQIKPPGSPPCWGKKYQDGEEECRQCHFNDGCRQEMFHQVSHPSLPVVRNYAPPPPPRLTLPTSSPPTTVVPLPPRSYFTQTTVPAPPPPRTAPPVVSQGSTQQQPQTYYQQSTGFSLPNPAAQNPLTPWHRPGAPSPAYYFIQHSGEGTGLRLIKNALLRALEAIFAELMQFFRHWTWPSVAAR